jgi:hypothetical protein
MNNYINENNSINFGCLFSEYQMFNPISKTIIN